jgi:hypothetical protein
MMDRIPCHDIMVAIPVSGTLCFPRISIVRSLAPGNRVGLIQICSLSTHP